MQHATSHLMRAYARQPVSFVRGSGARLWDEQGVEYLDAIAGVAVTSLGHAHPEIAAVIAAPNRPGCCCIPPMSFASTGRNGWANACAH